MHNYCEEPYLSKSTRGEDERMSKKQSRREKMQAKRRRKQLQSRLIWGGIGIGIIVLFGVMIWDSSPPVGEERFPIMSADHIPDSTKPEEYNSDPPTSGPHYSEGLPAGFYDETDLSHLSPYPVGHLVHNLEHGYIIFWYNCDVIEEAECLDLKSQIQEYLGDSPIKKLIAFPWKSIDVPLVLTSWGYMLELEGFDSTIAKDFIERNRMRAPEPNAP
jgi:hypothetical protein